MYRHYIYLNIHNCEFTSPRYKEIQSKLNTEIQSKLLDINSELHVIKSELPDINSQYLTILPLLKANACSFPQNCILELAIMRKEVRIVRYKLAIASKMRQNRERKSYTYLFNFLFSSMGFHS